MASNQAIDPAPVPARFIGGFRSGTTLLINLLGLHPEISPWFETKCLNEPLRWLRVLSQPDLETFERGWIAPSETQAFTAQDVASRMRYQMSWTVDRISGRHPHGKAKHERYPSGFDHVLYSLEEAKQALENWLRAVGDQPDADSVAQATRDLILTLGHRHAELDGKAVWVNKTPEIVRFGKELDHVFGRSKNLLLIRDGRDVVFSARYLQWGEVEKISSMWRDLILLSRENASATDHDYLEVRYEKLLSEPEVTLNRILDFYELEPLGKRIYTEYTKRMGGWKIRRPLLFRMQSLRGKDRRIFYDIAGDLLSDLGYE